jgi:hypothetical protein
VPGDGTLTGATTGGSLLINHQEVDEVAAGRPLGKWDMAFAPDVIVGVQEDGPSGDFGLNHVVLHFLNLCFAGVKSLA